MNPSPVTIAALVADYAIYGVTLGMIRAQAVSIAASCGVDIGCDHEPLPPDIVAGLRGHLDELAADFQAQIPARQAAYEAEVRRNGHIIA